MPSSRSTLQQGADERRLMFAIVQHFWSLFPDSVAQSLIFGHVWPRAQQIVPSCHSGRGEHRGENGEHGEHGEHGKDGKHQPGD